LTVLLGFSATSAPLADIVCSRSNLRLVLRPKGRTPMNTRFVAVVSVTFSLLLSAACGVAKGQAPAQATASADTKPEPIPSLAGRPDIEGKELLGGTYENPLAGISFQTPANCKQVKSNGGDEIV